MSGLLLDAIAICSLPTVGNAAASIGDAPPILDFMVMTACVDGADKVIPRLTPLDAGCVNRRKIRPGDLLPYHLSAFDGKAPDCPAHTTVNDSVLFEKDGTTRILRSVRVGYQLCGQPSDGVPAYYSVRWFDKSYGFILGAWSRGGDGNHVGGGITPQCKLDPSSSVRYFQNWPIAPAKVPEPGQIGFSAFSKASAIHGLPDMGSPCPDRYPARFLAIWTRASFAYTSGAKLDTIISHPYSQTDETGTTPGRGKQMERTYWTREFGQSRWENWKRDDYVAKSGTAANAMADESQQKGTCSKPFEMSPNPTPGIKLGPIESNGGYSQLLTDLKTGEQHRWFMTGCVDLTNVVLARGADGDPYPETDRLPAKFWEFWVPPTR